MSGTHGHANFIDVLFHVDSSRTGHRAVFRSGAWADHRNCWGSFDPNINRHTGRPHEHKREIARRQRQAARA